MQIEVKGKIRQKGDGGCKGKEGEVGDAVCGMHYQNENILT